MQNLLADNWWSQPQGGPQVLNPALGSSLNNILQGGGGGQAFFSKFLPMAVTLIMIVGSLIFFFILVSGAIQWITSGGDKQALEGARGKITNAVIGIILLFSAFAVVSLLETFFGIKILTLDIGPLVIQ